MYTPDLDPTKAHVEALTLSHIYQKSQIKGNVEQKTLPLS
jgi:hypothetical protein